MESFNPNLKNEFRLVLFVVLLFVLSSLTRVGYVAVDALEHRAVEFVREVLPEK